MTDRKGVAPMDFDERLVIAVIDRLEKAVHKQGAESRIHNSEMGAVLNVLVGEAPPMGGWPEEQVMKTTHDKWEGGPDE